MATDTAFLLVSFGGPEGPDDVMPFLRNVTAGRDVPDERLAKVAEHYDLFGGVSPINAQCRELLAAIRTDFAARGIDMPVYWGNRNWRPFLADTMRTMAGEGIGTRDRVRHRGLQLLLELPPVPGRHRPGPRRGRPRGAPGGEDPAVLLAPGLRARRSSAPQPARSRRCRPASGTGPSWSSPRTASPSPWPPRAARPAAPTRPSWPRSRAGSRQASAGRPGGSRTRAAAGRRPCRGSALTSTTA